MGTSSGEDGEETEEAAGGHGAESQPSPSPAVQGQREQRVRRKLRSGSYRERDEDIVAERAHVPDVSVEHERDAHPYDNQKYRDVPETRCFEQVQH